MLTGLVAPAVASGTGTINGKLTAPSGLLVDGYVELYRWSSERDTWDFVAYEEADADGSFTFMNIEQGDHYTIYFEPSGTPSEGYAPEQGYGGVVFNDYSRAGVSTFAVRGGAQSMTLPLSPGVEVKGKVVLPDGVPGPAEVEVERLEYVGHGGVPVVRRYEWVDMIETAPNGEFATRVIPGAWYSVAVKGTELIEPMSLNPPYLGESFSSARLVSGPTTLPTMTLQRAVPVRGRVTYQGTPAEGATARLVEIDPAGNRLSGPATTVAADGTFEFSGGAFPGRRYTVSVNYEGTTTYPGLARSRDAAVTYEAGPSGLTIPEFPLIVTSGPDWTRSVSVPDGVALRGSPTLGTTLSVRSGNGHLGVTSSTPGAQVIYRWTRDGEFIPGATGPQYTLTEEDQHTFVGALVVVRAPGRIAVGQRTNEVFVETGGAPYATSHPVVSGSAKVGGKLSVSRGSWSVPSVGLAYQWLRDGQPVVGATGASYTLKAADRGKRLSVRITASAPGRANGVSVTAPSAKVAKGDAAKVKKKPKVTGTKRVGKKLKVSKGTWSLKGVKFSYQWLRNGKKISKATKRTYKLKKKDLGKRISVRVTVKKAGYKNAKFVTKKTSKIKAKKKR